MRDLHNDRERGKCVEIQISKIISMIIQNLRQNNQGFIVDLIKKSEYSLRCLESDFLSETDYYRLRFHLNYAEYSKFLSRKGEIEGTIESALSSFYDDEQNVITKVELVAKIDQFVDWAAIAPQESKQSVLQLIDEEKDTLIKAGTGVIQIRGTRDNDVYKEKHVYILQLFKRLGLQPVHLYNDLWDWYNDYNQKELKSYQSRRIYIKELFEPLINTLQNSEEGTMQLIKYEPTGWDKIDESVSRMKDVLISANATADFQSVGMYCRELLISLAQVVFIKEKHPSPDGADIGCADSKRMLETYIHYCLHKRSKEREIKFAKAAIDFSNELAHNRTASNMDAELCYNAVLSTVHIIRVLSKYND